ncbi:unnamed protein product [Leuciscus chuanchicus]
MEWRIIVAVLCLIGILHVPGNAAQMNNSAIYYRFTLHFSMNGTFLDVYSNSTDNETVDLRKNITSKVEQLYKPKYTNFERFEILHIRKGSIVTEGELQFSNGSKPNVADLTQILNNGSFTFTIIQNATSIAEVTPQNQSTTATPATTPVTNQTATPVTNQTATPVTNQTATPVTTVSAPAKVAQINLVFSIAKDFKDTYSNLSDPETIDLSNSITTAGSIVTDSVLEFDSTNGTSPNVTEVKDTLVTAITNGNFNFTINNSSINTTDIPETSATPATTPVTNQTATPVTSQTATPVTTVSAPAKVAQINLVFSIVQEFKDIYSNLSNPETIDLSNSITTACSRVYKNRFPKFYRMFIRKFSKGSIVTDSVLEFDSTNGTSPNVTEVKNTLVTAIADGVFNFTINNSSISATDITETSANKSPVLASMLTALWMTLASLLLSAVMH